MHQQIQTHTHKKTSLNTCNQRTSYANTYTHMHSRAYVIFKYKTNFRVPTFTLLYNYMPN